MPHTKEELQEFSKQLIINCTKSERRLYKALTDLGFKFEFQYIIEPFIVDFMFSKSKCIVELDSPRFHNKIYDNSRDLYLNNAGYQVLRIKSYRCFKDMKKVLQEIQDFVSNKKTIISRNFKNKPTTKRKKK